MIDYQRARDKRLYLSATSVPSHGIVDDALGIESALSRRIAADEFRSAWAKMPIHYAEVVDLVLRGYGHLAIAEKLGIQYNTARSRYSRGKAMLLDILRKDDETHQLMHAITEASEASRLCVDLGINN